jgi:hypothetical protein
MQEAADGTRSSKESFPSHCAIPLFGGHGKISTSNLYPSASCICLIQVSGHVQKLKRPTQPHLATYVHILSLCHLYPLLVT